MLSEGKNLFICASLQKVSAVHAFVHYMSRAIIKEAEALRGGRGVGALIEL